MAADRNEELLAALDKAVNEDSQLVMVVVSNTNAMRYSAIKKKCCIDRIVPTQVVVLKTISPKEGRGLMSIATKVAIQINCKIGGAPWLIKIPLSGLMIVGFDVSHNTKNKNQ